MRPSMAVIAALALALVVVVVGVEGAGSKKVALTLEVSDSALLSASARDALEVRAVPDPLSESGRVLVSVAGTSTPTVASEVSIGTTLNLSVYDSCYVSDWSSSFNSMGTSYGASGAFITALYRSGITDVSLKATENPGINMLEAVQSCTPQRATIPVGLKVSADWWYSFGRTGWSTCPTNTYMDAMYRNTRRALDYLTYIEHVECAALDPVWSTGYSSCYTQDVTVAFDTAGWVSCAADYYVVGFWRYTEQWLHGLNKIRCCQPQINTISWVTGSWSSECTGTYTRSVTCQNQAGTTVLDSYCTATKPDTSMTCTIPDVWSWTIGEWGSCSATCGNATMVRSVTCTNQYGTRGDDSNCGDAVASSATCSDQPSCPSVGDYVYTSWSVCSATCGTGTQSRVVFCAADSCPGDMPESTQECDTEVSCEPIYSWSYTSYGDCSATCGMGVRTRGALCNTQWNTTVDASYCANVSDSASLTAVCDSGSNCYYEATVTEWSDCSATCGVGVKTRTVTCDFSYCYDAATEAACGLIACPVYTYAWATGDWSDCSATCGTVYSTRALTCVRTETGGDVFTVTVDGIMCADVDAPTSSQVCDGLEDCPVSGEYVTGDYGDCSASCGDGVSTRSVTCPTPSLGCNGDEPASSEACNIVDCAVWSWATGNWSDCSVTTCGVGTETRDVYCENQWGGVGTATECADAGDAPDSTATCEATNCDYPWTTSDWSDCSVTCGDGGVQTRTVTCTGDSIEWCADVTVPDTETSCEEDACPTYSWVGGDWSACTVTCGSGTASRALTCERDSDSVTVDASFCTGTAPDTSMTCEGDDECFTTYTSGDWSDCSVTCGTGTKTRTVECDGTCAGDAPASSEECMDSVCVCDTYEWSSGEWSDCSNACGKGMLTRTVTCVDENGITQTDTSLCTDTQPASSEECTEFSAAACDVATVVYEVGSWGDCSVTCGSGTVSRTVTCPAGDDLLCVGSKPVTSDTCTEDACETLYSWSKSDWSDCSTQCGTGTITRTVQCLAVADDSVVSASLCEDETPVSEEACTAYSIEVCEWQAGSWSDCNATCTESGVQTRAITCAVGSACQGDVPVSSTTCVYALDDCPLAYGWVQSEWSTCTETCGDTGIQTRTVQCLDSASGSIDAALCAAQAGSTPVSVQACISTDVSACLSWSTGSWGDCSVTCGLGVTTRTVTCAAASGQCLGLEPATEEDCNDGACVDTPAWAVTSWSTCSETCGVQGVQTRTVECVFESGMSGNADDCDDESPESSQVCSTISDECGAWVLGSWSDCGVTCGTGYQTRTVTCSADACVGSEPATSQECSDLLPCPTYSFAVTDWADCSVTCGYGTITRTVTCVEDSSSSSVGTELCTGDAPMSTDSCTADLTMCPNVYKWRVSDWASCDAVCGAGNQTRSVECINEDDEDVVDDALCLAVGGASESPAVTKCCFSADCVAWQMGTWSTCSSDVQTRTVACVSTTDGTEFEAAACLASSTAGAQPVTTQTC